MKVHGIFAPLVTPFGPDGSLDPSHLKGNITRYNATRLAGYVVNGSTGESVLLRWDEIGRAWRTAREAAAPDKILIAGTAAESTAETIEHTNRAADFGFHAALVRTPSYYKPQMTEEVEAEHFLRIADASRIPVLIYSVPVFTGIDVEAPLVRRLASHPNIIGIKESSGSVERLAEIIAAAPEEFQALAGSAASLRESLGAGAVGAILAIADVLPELCVAVYEAAKSGATVRALALQQQLSDAAAAIVSKFGIAGVKYALDRIGYFGGIPRPPLLPLTERAKKEIDAALEGVVARAKTNR